MRETATTKSCVCTDSGHAKCLAPATHASNPATATPRPGYVAFAIISDDGSWPRIPAKSLWSHTGIKLPPGLHIEGLTAVDRSSALHDALDAALALAEPPVANPVHKDCGLQTLTELIAERDALKDAAQDALEDITGPITTSGIKIRFSTRDKLTAALALGESKGGLK